MNQKLLAQAIRDLRKRKSRIEAVLMGAYAGDPGHLDDHDLELYHLGMLINQAEVTKLEEHLLICKDCVDRAEAISEWVNAMRAALTELGPPDIVA